MKKLLLYLILLTAFLTTKSQSVDLIYNFQYSKKLDNYCATSFETDGQRQAIVVNYDSLKTFIDYSLKQFSEFIGISIDSSFSIMYQSKEDALIGTQYRLFLQYYNLGQETQAYIWENDLHPHEADTVAVFLQTLKQIIENEIE